MRKILYLGILVLIAAGLFASPAMADSHKSDGKLKITGEVRVRGDSSDNTTDLLDDDTSSTLDDEFSISPYRARIAAHAHLGDNVDALIEMQAVGFYGDKPPANSPQTPLGQSSAGLDSFNSDVQLYQGAIMLNEVFGSKWSVSFGRMEHTLGNELHIGDLDFYNGQTFDGARARADFEKFDLDLFSYITAEFDPLLIGIGAGATDDDITFGGATFNIPIRDDGQVIEPYLLYLRDGDVDPATTVLGVKVWTLGALYGRPVDRDRDFDWSVEAALQTGDFLGSVGDLGGSIVEGWFGWSFGNDNTHRLHAGVLSASGDDDLADTDVDSFIPLFPDTHANNRLGNLDLFGGPTAVSAFTVDPVSGFFGMSNITDINLGWNWSHDRHGVMVAVHKLNLTEEDQIGLAEDDLGTEIDAVYDFKYSRNVAFQGGLSMFSPGDLPDLVVAGGSADDVMRAWWQLRLNWK